MREDAGSRKEGQSGKDWELGVGGKEYGEVEE